jgi:hypothetical protein
MSSDVRAALLNAYVETSRFYWFAVRAYCKASLREFPAASSDAKRLAADGGE